MTAIEFENISKQYRLGLVSTGTLSHDLNRLWTPTASAPRLGNKKEQVLSCCTRLTGYWQTKVLRRDDPYLKVGEKCARRIQRRQTCLPALVSRSHGRRRRQTNDHPELS